MVWRHKYGFMTLQPLAYLVVSNKLYRMRTRKFLRQLSPLTSVLKLTLNFHQGLNPGLFHAERMT